ncbi:MAG TPA: hypothetical protein VGK67_17455 [Myxococcales bacterium]|jgi:hypothetical protein
MGRGLALSLVVCAALSGAAIASVNRGAGLGLLAAGGAAGSVLGLWLVRSPGMLRRGRGHPLEAIAVVGVLGFFLPLLTMDAAPGADMAMHAAIARALVDGSDALSAAWGTVGVALYPKGLAASMALVAPAVGMAKASLLAAGLAHAVVLLGLAAFLSTVVRSRWPFALATLAVLASKSPQSFFDWGGNPTAMAFGLALFAVALLGQAWASAESPAPVAPAVAGASLLLLGAAATHPAGALAGLLSAAALPVLGRPTSKGIAGAVVALAVFGAGMLALWLGGPQVSPAEADWIADYQRNVEGVLRGPPALFAIEVWRGLAQRLGTAWTVTVAVAALVLLAARLWKPVVVVALAVVATGALLALGPSIPGAGVLLYPARFAPLLLVATAPLVGWAFERLEGRLRAPAKAALVALAVTAAVVNVRTFQRATPMVTRNDLAAIACVAKTVPKGAVIEGAYGDATQWIPALTGLAVTAAHPHITLDDEIKAQPQLRPTYRFVGERLRYGAPLEGRTPAGPALCTFGKAALIRLTE